MRGPQQGGPLERLGIRMKKEEGQALAKSNEATKAILDSIGSSTASTKPKAAVPGNYRASSGRMF